MRSIADGVRGLPPRNAASLWALAGARGENPSSGAARHLLPQGEKGRAHGAHAVFAAFNPNRASTASRITNFWILPVTVIGNSSTNSTYRGILLCAICP